jgi:hypothetical protein
MMQNMYIAYMRGLKTNPKPKYIKVLVEKRSSDKGKRQSKINYLTGI